MLNDKNNNLVSINGKFCITVVIHTIDNPIKVTILNDVLGIVLLGETKGKKCPSLDGLDCIGKFTLIG